MFPDIRHPEVGQESVKMESSVQSLDTFDALSSTALLRLFDESCLYPASGTFLCALNDYPSDIGHGTAQILIDIECFVDRILKTTAPAFLMSSSLGRVTYRATDSNVMHYFRRMERYLSAYSPHLCFSPKVSLFFCACQAVKAMGRLYTFPDEIYPDGLIAGEIFNHMIEEIRRQACTPQFQRQGYRSQERAKRNYVSFKAYVDALFEHRRARLIVIRLDLKYRHDNMEKMNTEQAQTDLKHLLDNMRGKQSLFGDLEGYIWKLECGGEGAEHFHVMFFFNNDHLQNDSHRGEMIGQYWVKVITEGRGTYFNCNRPEYKDKQARLKRLGIGRIEYADTEKRKHLDTILAYLCKSEQQIKAKPTANARTMGRGEMPEVREVRLGRPRERALADTAIGE